jgi:hypothetical protein
MYHNGIDKLEGFAQSYGDYVKAQALCNPCLLNLDKFLSSQAISRRSCRVTALDFRAEVEGLFSQTNVALHDLPSKLRTDGEAQSSLQGRIFIIEDLTKDIVELFGFEFSIDPLFFALHVGVSQGEGVSGRHRATQLCYRDS